MSVDHQARIEGVVKAHLKKISLREPTGFAVSYGFGPIFDPATGQMQGMGWGWAVMVSIQNILVGQNDIAGSLPVPGPLPPDVAFTKVTEFLFNKCLEERGKLAKPPAMPEGPAMALSERPA